MPIHRVFARMPVHLSGIVSEGQPTFCLLIRRAYRQAKRRLARGEAPSNPKKLKTGKV